MAANKKEYLWWVKAEDLCKVPVIAETWEQATLEAALFWGVPWAKVVAKCELVEKLPVVRNVCVRCGTLFNGSGVMCEHCRSEAEIEARRSAAASSRYFRNQNRRI